MTGPEHYRKAEALLDTAAKNFLLGKDASSALAAAQAHATLALAAATALPPGGPDTASRGTWVSAVHGLDHGPHV
ncbi:MULTISPECIES: hypothetical protein [Streptomyces]|uniref:hypothetical protein n=1 Tax=Streptomyces TaxID=1883 RepID=UPI00081B3F95|nr:hypothetical protein [Streptomyces sp. BvitLS-983]MYX88413.1 hypothetical protein [Streptomyces sp. SID4915]SCE16518.1 hypothetical protein GA0115250_144741 [Streptomyces sp. BvitLS-983]